MQKSQGVIKILSDLVAIDSQSYKSNKKIITLVRDWFKDYPCETQDWIADDGVKGQNLIVTIAGKSSEKCFVFVCHLDTVPASAAWETDPFILEEQEGKLYGLGACDTKGGIAALIAAALGLSDKPAYDTYIIFDGDEETGSAGAKKFKKHFSKKNSQFIFIEPTENNVMIAQRSSFHARVKTYGVAQHASLGTPEKNEKNSAIYKISKVLSVLIDDAKYLSHEIDPLLGSNSQNLGKISGGTAENVIPDNCEVTIDRRLLPHKNFTDETKRLKKMLKLIDKSVELTDARMNPGFHTDEDSPYVGKMINVMKKYYPKVTTAPFLAWSEAGLFGDQKEVIILGPGSLIGQAHKANEFVESQDLFHFVHIFQDIMINV